MKLLVFIVVASLALVAALVPTTSQTPKSLVSNVKESGAAFFPSIAGLTAAAVASSIKPAFANDGKYEYQPALKGLDYGKPRTYYPDFTQSTKGTGLQVSDRVMDLKEAEWYGN